MSNNPYSSPNNPFGPTQEYQRYDQNDGFVRQIPVVGILNIVQGSLEALMAVFLIGFTIIMANIDQFTPPNGGQPSPPMPVIAIVMYGIVAGGVLLLAVMRIVGGVSILRRRNRVLAIVASVAGIATSLTCYCAPSSIVLTIYSLIVLLQPTVIAEFERP